MLWVGKWGHLTQSKLLRVPNSLGHLSSMGAPGKWADTMVFRKKYLRGLQTPGFQYIFTTFCDKNEICTVSSVNF